ncbi:GGDEF and EAL domain-containing protein [Oceanimonas baumannii]|uniref:EAL domain-containing protein n=1 Tax=Oceanimonas baumannii TaxID=129578 RepID=UPI001D18E9C8|nr:EAL domain-containing protein [Oceanimonas baumannii]MCC4263096.1 GGDEF and EAL domain-containing protein [Oceanimonas baumannii]
MRESRSFSQALLCVALILMLLSVLLPWWAARSSLAMQQQQLNQQLPALLSALPAQPRLPGISAFSRTSPPLLADQAWWCGELAQAQQLGQAPVFYTLDTGTATRQWLSVSAPLALLSLILCVALQFRLHRVQRARQQYLLTLMQQPEQTDNGLSDPLAQEIMALHRRHQQQQQALQQKLEEAQLQSQRDSLTTLGNRYAFRRDLTHLLANENRLATATLMMVRAIALQDINSRHGFQAGDQYLQNIARLIRKVIQSRIGAHAYRISGSDIAVLIPGQCDPLASALGSELQQELYHYQHIHELDCVAYIGFTQLLPGQSPESILIRADSALAQAQSGEPNGWRIVMKNSDDEDLGESQWRQRLQSMLDGDQILLMIQPARLLKPSLPGYNEVFTHFPNENGGVYPSSTVFAMLQRLGMSMLFEQKIIEMILQQVALHDLPGQRWAINLTPASLQQSSFLIWLERVLMRNSNVTASLVFELDEHVLEHQLSHGKRLIEMLRRSGARSAMSKFGHGYGSFRLLKDIKPDYVKLDPELVRHLEDDSANQQFVRMIIDLAQRLGCHVVAEGVETEDQKRLLETMYIDGVQGYLVSKPLPLAEFSTRAAGLG